jgi:arabinofuranosyltransferase
MRSKQPGQKIGNTLTMEKSLPLFLGLLLMVLIIRRAWVSEDAYITMRTVSNFLQGYGLTWNIVERVQPYTHPLWMFVITLIYFFTRESYLTLLAISLAATLAAILLYARFPGAPKSVLLFGLTALICSNAFIDYSTSGLENPLTHLLLVLFFSLYVSIKPGSRRNFLLALVTALIGINRTDAMLLCLPLWLLSLFENHSRRGWLFALLGLLPLIAWELFSLFYYGFPFPNTFYAKLNTGIPEANLLRQGLTYFINSIIMDPATLVVIALGIAAGLASKKKGAIAGVIGIGLYLLYILRIGGDFMSGRFFAAPLLCAVMVLAMTEFHLEPTPAAALPFVAILLLGISAPLPTFELSDPRMPGDAVDSHGIADERRYYQNNNSLLSYNRGMLFPNNDTCRFGAASAMSPDDIVSTGNIGIFGYCAGSDVYILDEYSLADPLLARLPITYEGWRIGHFTRDIPEGYLETLTTGINQIKDENVAEYYDKLKSVIRGKLWDWNRVREIWNFNTGKYDYLINESEAYGEKQITLEDIDAVSTIPIPTHGVRLALGSYQTGANVQMGVDFNDDYLVNFYNDKIKTYSTIIRAIPANAQNTRIVNLEIPKKQADMGYNYVEVLPLAGDEPYYFIYMSISGEDFDTRSTHKLSLINTPKPAETPWDAPGNIQFTGLGIRVDMEGVIHSGKVEVSLDHNDEYLVEFFLGDSYEYSARLPNRSDGPTGLRIEIITVPDRVLKTGYDSIKIVPINGDNMYSLGHLRVLE